jgi:hypothetical protein
MGKMSPTITFRLLGDLRQRLEALQEELSKRACAPVSRTNVLKLLLDRGFTALEQELDLKTSVAKQPKP